MLVVHLTNYFMSEFGYQEYYLAKYHSEIGHEVHVICSNRTYPKQREYKFLLIAQYIPPCYNKAWGV
jgi:hypothetical protein